MGSWIGGGTGRMVALVVDIRLDPGILLGLFLLSSIKLSLSKAYERHNIVLCSSNSLDVEAFFYVN